MAERTARVKSVITSQATYYYLTRLGVPSVPLNSSIRLRGLSNGQQKLYRGSEMQGKQGNLGVEIFYGHLRGLSNKVN
jgi:hypothetical protein